MLTQPGFPELCPTALMKRVFYLACLLVYLIFQAQKGHSQAVITPGPVTGQMTSCEGVQSIDEEYQYFQLLGFNLTGPVNVSAPAGFVVSANKGAGFQGNITLTPTKGAIVDTIFVRLGPAAPTGSVSGFITLTATGVGPQTVNVSGTVLNMPTVNPEPNITVLNGATLPALPFEGTGNMYSWTTSNPNIGLASSGIDSLPTFRALNNSDTTITATITVTPVLAGTAYVTDAGAGSVSVINTLTNTLDTSIPTGGKGPTSETLSPNGSVLYVLNSASQTIGVINTIINRLVFSFKLSAKAIYPYQIALNHDGTQLYVINFGSGDFSVFDAQTGSPLANLAAGGTFPSEIAFSPSGNLFYIGANQNIDQGLLLPFAAPGNMPLFHILVPTYPGAPKYPPPVPYLNMVFSPDSTRLYAADGNVVTVINTITQSAIATLRTGYYGHGSPVALAISPDGKQLYVLVNGVLTNNDVQIFDTATNSLVQSVIIDDGIPTGLCISPDGINLYVSCTGSNTVAVVNTQTYLVTTNIPVGNSPEINTFCIKPGGCFGNPITFTITINAGPVPSIEVSADSLTALTTTYGTPSSVESFTVSGKFLRSGILLTAPRGFEISTDNANFSDSLTVNGSGTIANTTVYIRLAAADVVGNYSGHVVLTSPGAANVSIYVPKSTVTPTNLVITADNKSKAFGAPTPVLTASYQGFENNDGEAQLVFPPALGTTAVTNSPAGAYPITAGDAYSPDYTISYVQGVLTITPDVIIPNTFTPNGDGINDAWNIQKIGDYPKCTVQVFNRYGLLVYSSVGYGIPWDGTYNGARLLSGTYYYIINLNAGVPLLSGFVTLIR
jgi:gliding motility-associated-like protein